MFISIVSLAMGGTIARGGSRMSIGESEKDRRIHAHTHIVIFSFLYYTAKLRLISAEVHIYNRCWFSGTYY